MTIDERAIRDLMATWQEATARGDTPGVLKLMTEDVVFLVPGRPPIRGKSEYAALSAGSPMRFQSKQDVMEIEVVGEWAYGWTHLSVAATPVAGGATVRRSGHTLSVFRKQGGAWLLARDANLLAPEPPA